MQDGPDTRKSQDDRQPHQLTLNPVDGGLSEQRVGHLGEQLIRNWHTFVSM